MNRKPDDILCFELGTDKPPWVGSADLLASDREAVQRLADNGIIKFELKGREAHISGVDRVGLVLLPSGRRLVIRSKIENLVLLRWLAYLGEFPPLEDWLADAGVTTGVDFPTCIARLFLYELERVTRVHVRKDYTAVISHEPTIRGRIITTQLYRRLNRLPHVPQWHRSRTFNTPYNIVLALALDKLPMLLAGASQSDRTLFARIRDLWAHVQRDMTDPVSAVTEAQWACPPGYRAALQLARLNLIGAALDPTSGLGGQAFTLSLALVWERSLRKMFDELADVTGWKCVPDSSRTRKWDDSAGRNDSTRWMTVDVMVERNVMRWVLDAKYKRAFRNESRSDRFQMCAYAVGFDADRVSLVFPTATIDEHESRVLLETAVRQKVVIIDSLELPMMAGPEACKAGLLKASDMMQDHAPKTQLMDLDRLNPNPIMHETLPERLTEKLRVIYRHFAYLSFPAFEQFELEFLRDADPEIEIANWTRMALIFRGYCTHESLSEEEKPEIHKLLLEMSLGVEPDDPRCRKIRRIAQAVEHSVNKRMQ